MTLLGDAPPARDLTPTWWPVFEQLAIRWTAAAVASEHELAATAERLRLPPYIAVLAGPAVDYALDCLRQRQPRLDDILMSGAFGSMERQLARRLSRVSGQVLKMRFQAVHAAQTGSGQAERSRTHMAMALRDGARDLLTAFPLLGRRVAETVSSWVSVWNAFIHRLEADRSDLGTLLHADMRDVRVSRLETAMSDPHNGGHVVLGVHFENGGRCVYKPRPIEAEQTFYELLAWLNTRGLELTLRTLVCLPRPEYGWVETAVAESCENESAVERFYRRTGYLLALAHAVNGTDFHRDNILACGEHPVLVDLETLLTPPVAPGRTLPADEAGHLASRQLWQDSVLRTAMLPRWTHENDSAAMDINSGIAWADYDGLSARIAKRGSGNVPVVSGAPALVAEHLDAVITGFKEMYARLVALKDELLSHSGPLVAFKGVRTRFVFRDTNTYGKVLQRLSHPSALTSGNAGFIQSEVLQRSPSPLPRTESSSLAIGDVPLAWTDSLGTDLRGNHGEVCEDFFAECGYDAVRRRIEGLNEDDERRQVVLITSLFGTSPSRGDSPLGHAAPDERATLDAEDVAVRLARRIADATVYGPDRTATWIARVYDRNKGAWVLQPIGLDLFDGVVGVAVFLAAVKAVTGDTCATKPLEGCLRRLRKATTEQADGVGAGKGHASIVYGALAVGTMLGDDEWIDEGVRRARLLAQVRLESISSDDVMDGLAGAVLGLLVAHAAEPERALLDRAESGADALLSRLHPSETRVNRPALGTGMAHGAAGIAMALMRLYGATGKPRYRDVATALCATENACCDPLLGNARWQVAARNARTWNSWCRGSTGIGLARLNMLDIWKLESLRDDVMHAADTPVVRSLADVDHPCCGTFGRVELLLATSLQMMNTDLRAAAQQLAAAAYRRARTEVGFRGVGTGLLNPTLHQGASGIGYSLLRLSRPDVLRSVLAWQPFHRSASA